MKDLKVIISAIVVFIVVIFLMFFIATKNSTKRAYELYSQGLRFYSQNDFHNAYYNFSKISPFSEIYELSILKQGLCALNVVDKKTAYKKFNYLSNMSNNPHIAPIALYQAALINMEHKKYSYAYRKLKKLYQKYPDSDYKKAAAYQLGLLFKSKNPRISKDYFVEYLQYAPSGRYALSAIDEIFNLKIFLTNEEKYVIAYSYYENGKYQNAISLAEDLNISQAVLLCAKSFEQIGNSKSALLCYTKLLTICDEKISQKDIAIAVSKYINLSNLNKKDACEILLKSTKKTVAYPAVLYEYASTLSKMNSIKCYETIYTRYPDSYQAAQSLWKVFLYTYQNGYSAKAKVLAQQYLNNYSNKNSTPAMKFWHAKILLKEGKTMQAKQEFRELIKTEPDSYYAFVAHNLLKGVHTPFNSANFATIPANSEFSADDLKNIFNNDKLLLNVAMLNDVEMLKQFRLHDDFMLSYISYKDNHIPYSVFLARKGFSELKIKPQHADARYKLAYPLVFSDYINLYSEKYSQNPYLMLALIREESTFNTHAQSSVGATGLMQLMPATASSLNVGVLSADMLYDPKLNIGLGIKYFSSLKSMFSGNEMLAVLSYNGGPSNVNRWSAKLNEIEFDEFVEDIPYSETQNYIKRVFGTYWNYIRIYSK